MFGSLRKLIVLSVLGAAVAKLWPIVQAKVPAAKKAADSARERIAGSR